jgi:hypothetical protein
MKIGILLAFFIVLTFTSSRKPDVGIGNYEEEKVLLELFYEAECPYCTQFMGNQLAELITIPVIYY